MGDGDAPKCYHCARSHAKLVWVHVTALFTPIHRYIPYSSKSGGMYINGFLASCIGTMLMMSQ